MYKKPEYFQVSPCKADVIKGNNLEEFKADTFSLWPTQTDTLHHTELVYSGMTDYKTATAIHAIAF